MTFAEVLPALAAGKKVRRNFWGRMGESREYLIYKARPTGHPILTTGDLLATDWEIVEEPASDGHHPRCARVPGYCGVQCDVRKVAETMAATIARLERELRDLRAGVNTDRAVLLRDLEDTRRVRDQRWADAKEAKAEQYRLKALIDANDHSVCGATHCKRSKPDDCPVGLRGKLAAATPTLHYEGSNDGKNWAHYHPSFGLEVVDDRFWRQVDAVGRVVAMGQRQR